MYDDLGSLAEKLKMSGVSFQEMSEEHGETMQAVTTTPAITEANTDAPETTPGPTSTARKEANHASALSSVPTNTVAWPKNRPAPETFNTSSGGILDSVAAMSHPAQSEIRERNPVRLDMLFTVIGK